MKQPTIVKLILVAAMFLTSVLFSKLALAASGCDQAAAEFTEASKVKNNPALEESYYLKAIQHCPSMLEAHRNLAYLQRAQGKAEEAEKSLKKALQVKDDFSIRLALGELLLQANKIAEAREQYELAKNLEPQNGLAISGLAVTFERAGNLSEARRILDEAISKGIKEPSLLFNSGALYERKSELQSAIENYRAVLVLDPQNQLANLRLGICLHRQGKNEEARTVLEKGLEGSEKEAAFAAVLGSINIALGDYSRAEVHLRKAVELEPEKIEHKLNLVVALLKNEQVSKAESILAEIAVNKDNNAQVQALIGWTKLEQGKLPEAEKALQRAIDLNPQDALARNNLGVVQMRQGRDEEARKNFAEALKHDPQLESAQRNLMQLGS